ncbi:hypothetical protein ACIRP5_37285 [Streptomyces sp. NPDC101221]|uniref:hypothetical protein n=1 Tax=Streptomyces sp. NPDC101221 TaxID=3366132 RepID=UPI0038209C80
MADRIAVCARALDAVEDQAVLVQERQSVAVVAVPEGVRQTEITDSLVDLFIQLVLKKVRGKEGMLPRVAEAALSEPSGTVRRVIFPVVGGEKTLKALAAEVAANEARCPGPYGAAVVVLGALAADACAAVEGAEAEVQQHRIPAGDARDRSAEAVPGAAAEGGRVLRPGGDGAAGGCGSRSVAGGGCGRQGPRRAHPV